MRDDEHDPMVKAGDLAPATPAAQAVAPALGSLVQVTVAEGCKLINRDTGGYFAPGQATPVTVTITLLRRLQDQDLVLVP